MPADTITVARFLVNLGLTCTFTTRNNYLSAIIALHKFFGHVSNFRDSFILQLVLKGLARTLGKEVSQKVGLSPQQLLKIHARLDFSELNVVTKWAAIILSFRSLLRKANIVPSTYKDMGMVIL